MSTPDPNAPVQQAGETAYNFLCRLQQYAYSQGAGPSGANPGMAQQWIGICAKASGAPAPSGFTIK